MFTDLVWISESDHFLEKLCFIFLHNLLSQKPLHLYESLWDVPGPHFLSDFTAVVSNYLWVKNNLNIRLQLTGES